MMEVALIQTRIYEIRAQKVMLDFDLAELYEVNTKVLNQAIKRNRNRFPIDFMFRLSIPEWETMRSQIVTASQTKRNIKATPYAFTEHGVTMLASILRSEIAIQMNIAIVKAFIALRKWSLNYSELTNQLHVLKSRVGEHDTKLVSIYKAIEKLLEEKVKEESWENRKRIGFGRPD
jgi:hypothetical protein